MNNKPLGDWRKILKGIVAAGGFYLTFVVGISNPYLGLALAGVWAWLNWRYWHFIF